MSKKPGMWDWIMPTLMCIASSLLGSQALAWMSMFDSAVAIGLLAGMFAMCACVFLVAFISLVAQTLRVLFDF